MKLDTTKDIYCYIDMILTMRHLTRTDLAEKTNQSKANLSQKFVKKTFKFSEIEKIAEALGADIDIKFIDKKNGEPLL